MDKMIVKELIQNDLNRSSLSAELSRIIMDEQVSNRIRDAYEDLREKLGGEGASDRAAGILTNFLKNN
jgi:lipid-A-disaccharide synthase